MSGWGGGLGRAGESGAPSLISKTPELSGFTSAQDALEAMETKEQLRFRFAVIRATAKIRHNRGEVLSGSTRSEEESGGGGGGAIEEVVPLVDVVYGCVIAGLGMFDERAEIMVIFQSLDKTSI